MGRCTYREVKMGVRAKQSLVQKVAEFVEKHDTATSPAAFYENIARKLNINRTDAKSLCSMQGVRFVPTAEGPYLVQQTKP